MRALIVQSADPFAASIGTLRRVADALPKINYKSTAAADKQQVAGLKEAFSHAGEQAKAALAALDGLPEAAKGQKLLWKGDNWSFSHVNDRLVSSNRYLTSGSHHEADAFLGIVDNYTRRSSQTFGGGEAARQLAGSLDDLQIESLKRAQAFYHQARPS